VLEFNPNYTKALLRVEDLKMLCILEKFQNEKIIQYAEKLVKILGEMMFKEEIKVRYLTFRVFFLKIPYSKFE
jgi:hypothetical protein